MLKTSCRTIPPAVYLRIPAQHGEEETAEIDLWVDATVRLSTRIAQNQPFGDRASPGTFCTKLPMVVGRLDIRFKPRPFGSGSMGVTTMKRKCK